MIHNVTYDLSHVCVASIERLINARAHISELYPMCVLYRLPTSIGVNLRHHHMHVQDVLHHIVPLHVTR